MYGFDISSKTHFPKSKLSKAKFSHFDRTRGDKNQIFRTQDQCGSPAMMTSSARTIELRPLTQQQWSSLEVILEVC